MDVIIIIMVLSLTVKTCQAENQRFVETLYLAENRALLNHVFQWKTGRDCFMDPHCASFNCHVIKGICVLNNASRVHSPDNFVEIQESVFYDDNVNTL